MTHATTIYNTEDTRARWDYVQERAERYGLAHLLADIAPPPLEASPDDLQHSLTEVYQISCSLPACPGCRDRAFKVYLTEILEADGWIECDNCGTALVPLEREPATAEISGGVVGAFVRGYEYHANYPQQGPMSAREILGLFPQLTTPEADAFYQGHIDALKSDSFRYDAVKAQEPRHA